MLLETGLAPPTPLALDIPEMEIQVPIIIPENWRRTIQILNKTAEQAGIGYAEVGSLSLAIMTGNPWCPTKIEHNAPVTRDLDIFLIGSDIARTEFRELLETNLQASVFNPPSIDIV